MTREKKLKSKQRMSNEEQVSISTASTLEQNSRNTPNSVERKRKRSRSHQLHRRPVVDAFVVNDNKKNSDHGDLAEGSETASGASNKENKAESSKSAALKALSEENEVLKKEIARLQAEVAFKDQVIESLQAESKKLKPGLTCVVCVEYMTNPCTISCGHTFCYECLRDWTKVRKECPTCRMKITQKPTLSFAVKEQVETFVERLPHDEREVSKQRLKIKEDTFNKLEDPWVGIFVEQNLPITDDADGVRRCTNCAWEVVGTHCANCGHSFFGSDDEFETSESETDMDEIISDALRVGLDYDLEDSFIDGRETEEILSGDSYTTGSESNVEDGPPEDAALDDYESDTTSSESTQSTASIRRQPLDIIQRENATLDNYESDTTSSSNSPESTPGIIQEIWDSVAPPGSQLPSRFRHLNLSPEHTSQTRSPFNNNDGNNPSPLSFQVRRATRRKVRIESSEESSDGSPRRPNDPSSSIEWLQFRSPFRPSSVSYSPTDETESENEMLNSEESESEDHSEENSGEGLASSDLQDSSDVSDDAVSDD